MQTQKGSVTIVVFIVFLLTLGGAAAYFKNSPSNMLTAQPQTEETKKVEATLVVEESKTSTDTSLWQTYTDVEYGFEVQYPQEFIKNPVFPQKFTAENMSIFEFDSMTQYSVGSGPAQIIKIIVSTTPFQKYMALLNREEEIYAGDDTTHTTARSSLKVAGKDAIQRTISGLSIYSERDVIINAAPDYTLHIVFLSISDEWYEHILATLKFTK